MGDVIIWMPKEMLTGQENLAEFISFAKEKLTIYNDQEDSYGKGWDAGKWKTNTHGRSIAMVFGFSINPYNIERLFEKPFMDFAKAFVKQQQTISESKSVADWLYVFRVLHDVLKEKHPDGVPSILDVDVNVQMQAEEVIKLDEKADGKKYHFGGKLESLYKWLNQKQILHNLPVRKNPFPKGKNKIEQTDKESEKWREERCPSMHQMLSFADCFVKAESVKDQFYTSALVLLCFAPGRGDELNSLTINSLQEEDGKYYVTWYAGKGFGATRKWVPTVMIDVVKEAFKRLIEIGRPARDAAKFAAENPGKFMRHMECVTPLDFDENEELTCTQFLNAMSMKDTALNGRVLNWGNLPQKWIKNLLEKGPITYSELGKLVGDTYKDRNWPKNIKTDRPVWENLCIVRDFELSDDDVKPKAFSWTTSISVNQINDQLRRRLKGQKTLWDRFGIKDEDGSEISLTSHQFRVWLNTHLMKSGMDDYQIAKWSGRADVTQNRAYDGRTKDEKERLQNEIMKLDHKQKPSPLELLSALQPVPLPSLGIKREGVADFTGLGFCTHNFDRTPCTKAGECITCKEHVCIKGLPESLEQLEQMELLINEQFESAKAAAIELTFGADRWVTHFGWKLAHIRTIIEKMKDPEVSVGTLIRIPVAHDPSPTRRALSSKGMLTELDNTEMNHNEIAMQLKLLGAA